MVKQQTEQDRALSGLRALLDGLDSESGLVGYALQNAAIKIGNNWLDAIGDGFKGNLVDDVVELIYKLLEFQEKARDVLPISNGGFGGHPKSFWIETLSLVDVSIYEAEDLPGHFGFTGCDADDSMSFDEALHAALVANPDVVEEVESKNDSSLAEACKT